MAKAFRIPACGTTFANPTARGSFMFMSISAVFQHVLWFLQPFSCLFLRYLTAFLCCIVFLDSTPFSWFFQQSSCISPDFSKVFLYVDYVFAIVFFYIVLHLFAHQTADLRKIDTPPSNFCLMLHAPNWSPVSPFSHFVGKQQLASLQTAFVKDLS